MPSTKQMVWTVGLALATILAYEHYKTRQAGTAKTGVGQRLRSA